MSLFSGCDHAGEGGGHDDAADAALPSPDGSGTGEEVDARGGGETRPQEPTALLTSSGPVEGTESQGVRRFLGIPYAAPP